MNFLPFTFDVIGSSIVICGRTTEGDTIAAIIRNYEYTLLLGMPPQLIWDATSMAAAFQRICNILKGHKPTQYEHQKRFPDEGFQIDPDDVMALRFTEEEHMNHCANFFKKPRDITSSYENQGAEEAQYTASDAHIPLFQQFLRAQQLSTGRWLHVRDPQPVASKFTKCKIEIVANPEQFTLVDPALAATLPIKRTELAFDIECARSGESAFPNHYKLKDPCFCITVVISRNGVQEEEYMFTALRHYKRGYRVKGLAEHVIVMHCGTVLNMIAEFTKFVDTIDPDIIAGHNLLYFDVPYLFVQAAAAGSCLGNMSRFLNNEEHERKMRKILTKRRGYGEVWNMQGRVFVDTEFYAAMLFPNEQSYKLKDLAKKAFPDDPSVRKIDMDYMEIFAAFNALEQAKDNNDDAIMQAQDRMDKVLVYGQMDAYLVPKLMNTWNVVNIMFASAFVCNILPEDVQNGLRRHEWQISRYHEYNTSPLFYTKHKPYPAGQISTVTQGGMVLTVDQTDIVNFTKNALQMALPKRSTDSNKAVSHTLDNWLGHKPPVPEVLDSEEEDSDDDYDDDEKREEIISAPDVHMSSNTSPGIAMCVTFDFAGLYPSIMIAHNMSRDTVHKGGVLNVPTIVCDYMQTELVTEEVVVAVNTLENMKWKCKPLPANTKQKALLKPVEPVVRKVLKSVHRNVKYRRQFVQKHVRVGITTRILERVLAKREQIKIRKRELKDLQKLATDPRVIEDLKYQFVSSEGEEKAIKILANSSYGDMASDGDRGDVGIAQAITGIARQSIQTCKEFVEARGMVVRYGDTDSIMVEVPSDWEVGTVYTRAKALAAEMTTHFPPPMKMEFESQEILFTVKKKSYVKVPVDEKGIVLWAEIKVKGLMTARRDCCAFAARTYNAVIMAILEKKSCAEALKIYYDAIRHVAFGVLEPSDFVVCNQFLAGKKGGAITEYVERIRRGGHNVLSGDRLSFVVVQQSKSANVSHNVSQNMMPANEVTPNTMLDRGHYIAALKKIDTLLLAAYYKEFERCKDYVYLVPGDIANFVAKHCTESWFVIFDKEFALISSQLF